MLLPDDISKQITITSILGFFFLGQYLATKAFCYETNPKYDYFSIGNRYLGSLSTHKIPWQHVTTYWKPGYELNYSTNYLHVFSCAPKLFLGMLLPDDISKQIAITSILGFFFLGQYLATKAFCYETNPKYDDFSIGNRYLGYGWLSLSTHKISWQHVTTYWKPSL